MPFVRVVHNAGSDKTEALASAISKATASALGKPEMYVCIDCVFNEKLLFGGDNTGAAMIQVQSIGGSCSKVCESLTTCTSSVLGIDASRIFVNFQNFSGSEWGMNGSTFG
jgi:phenylpyruvate tautomerase